MATKSSKGRLHKQPNIARWPAIHYPWCTIGKVFVGWNSNFNNTLWTGSGCLLGKNITLTANHVIYAVGQARMVDALHAGVRRQC
jgi:hypothetical protein